MSKIALKYLENGTVLSKLEEVTNAPFYDEKQLLTEVDIEDSLTSSDATKALSAKQGMVLKSKIQNVEYVSLVVNVDSTLKTSKKFTVTHDNIFVDSITAMVPGCPGLLELGIDITFNPVGKEFTISDDMMYLLYPGEYIRLSYAYWSEPV